MRVLKQVAGASQNSQVLSSTDRLQLYERYGAMAYGIICPIVTDPAKAERVLIDLFTSAPLVTPAEPSPKVACAIVRLARTKALEWVNQHEADPPMTDNDGHPNDNLPKRVFDLSFRKGIKLEVIAERLEMTYFDVLKIIREYVKSIRTC
jgi:hypothetical protein